jgi:hypothetical protein
LTAVANQWGIWKSGYKVNEFGPNAGVGLATSDRRGSFNSVYLEPQQTLPLKFNYTGARPNWIKGRTWTNPFGFYNFEFELIPEASGALQAQSATVSGTAISSSLTTDGAVSAGASTVTGTGTAGDIIGSGVLTAGSATASGAATSSSIASGSPDASSADVNGTGLSSSIAFGLLFASAASADGASVSSSIASGVCVAGSAQVHGVGFVGIPPVGGAGRLNSMLIMIGIRIN